MNTLKTIFEKLAKADAIESKKIELANHEVKLADEMATIQKAQAQSIKDLESANLSSKAVIASIDKAIDGYKKGLINVNSGLTLIENVKKTFANIGFPAPSNLLQWEKDLINSKKISDSKLKSLENSKKLF